MLQLDEFVVDFVFLDVDQAPVARKHEVLPILQPPACELVQTKKLLMKCVQANSKVLLLRRPTKVSCDCLRELKVRD